MTSVLIAIPTLDWSLNTQLASFLLRLNGGGLLPDPLRVEVCFLPDTQPVHYARNILVGAFLQGTCDALWFLDADVTPTDDAVRVLQVDADVVTGRAPIVRPGDDGEPCIVHAAFSSKLDGGAFGYAPVGSEPTPIVAAGAGCLLVRRHVLADPRMHLAGTYATAFGEPNELTAEERVQAPAVFRMPSKPNGEPLLGEDMDFVYRASQLGYRCMFDARASCGHIKRVDLGGVERMIGRAAANASSK